MGLDMYLIKRKKSKNKVNNNLWNFKNELIYWRKANQIHNYFCNKGIEIEEEISYKLSKKDLEELLDICNKILEEVKTKQGKISNGYTFEQNSKGELTQKHIFEDGLIITNPEVCQKLLPTKSGFFFGSTEYDEYYLQDIKYTKQKLEEIINELDNETDDIYYLASW